MIERLCMVFYDAIRPRVIHVAHIETLSELCTIVRHEMLADRCGISISTGVSEQQLNDNVTVSGRRSSIGSQTRHSTVDDGGVILISLLFIVHFRFN